MQLVALNDFDNPVAGLRDRQRSTRSAIGRVCEDAYDGRKQSSRTLVQDEGHPVAILDIGRMNRRAQQQAEGIYKNVALLALDLLSRIVAMRIVRPPFSALFTL